MSLTVLSTYRRLCSDCEHGYLGPQGVFCVQFQEPVDDDAAADCPEFDPQPEAARPKLVRSVEVVAKVATEGRGKGVWVASTREDLVDMCEQYLSNRHCVLWGEPFEIVTPKGRREAAEWLAAQIAGLGPR